MQSSRFWIDLTTREFAALDWDRVIVVAPIAAVEQHGPHLPVGVDAQIMQGCIDRVVPRLPGDIDVLFLPIQSVGVSVEHRDFPGTLSFSPSTAFAMLTEVVEGAIAAGAQNYCCSTHMAAIRRSSRRRRWSCARVTASSRRPAPSPALAIPTDCSAQTN